MVGIFKLAICDDDVEFRRTLEKYVCDFFSDKESEYFVRTFDNPSLLAESIEGGFKYDLIFLDILFGDENGMFYAKELRGLDKKTEIIFITTTKEYAIESYDVDPLYYIMKPLDGEKLDAALERFIDKHMPRSFCFGAGNGMIKLHLDEILFFEVYGHRLTIHKTDGTKVCFHGSLKDIQSKLPNSDFIRPHRSYIVNMNFISEIARFDIKMSNGALVPISKALFGDIQHKFLNFLDEKDLFI